MFCQSLYRYYLLVEMAQPHSADYVILSCYITGYLHLTFDILHFCFAKIRDICCLGINKQTVVAESTYLEPHMIPERFSALLVASVTEHKLGQIYTVYVFSVS